MGRGGGLTVHNFFFSLVVGCSVGRSGNRILIATSARRLVSSICNVEFHRVETSSARDIGARPLDSMRWRKSVRLRVDLRT